MSRLGDPVRLGLVKCKKKMKSRAHVVCPTARTSDVGVKRAGSAIRLDRMKRAATASRDAANKRGRTAGKKAVAAAEARGLSIINHGAGTMPVDAPAPYNGVRYTLLEQPADAPALLQVEPHCGSKTDGALHFADAPNFRPTLTPSECIRKGIFGGCYFNPRGGKPGIFGRDVEVSHEEFPAAWFEGVAPCRYMSRRYNVPTNCHRVKSGFGQKEWESKGWIHVQDPRGWFQCACHHHFPRDRSARPMLHEGFNTSWNFLLNALWLHRVLPLFLWPPHARRHATNPAVASMRLRFRQVAQPTMWSGRTQQFLQVGRSHH